MAMLFINATPSAAVATAGTIAFTAPDAATAGRISLQGGHKLYAEGLQNHLDFNAGDFSLSVSGATITITYKGTTSIPAGTLVRGQFELPGPNNYLDDGKGGPNRGAELDYLSNVRSGNAILKRISFGAVATASATVVLNAQARAGTTINTYTTPVTLDVPRGLAVKSSTTDTTQTVTVRGFDEYGVAISETFTLNGTTAVNGKKAFKVVTSDINSAALAGNLSIGTSAGVLGLPYFLAGGTSAGAGYTAREVLDGTIPTAGTFVGGDLTIATATTGDVRGTWTPNTAPNGARVFEVFMYVDSQLFKGINQYGS